MPREWGTPIVDSSWCQRYGILPHPQSLALLPFGALVYRSGFIPRLFGVLLIVAGFAYMVSTLTFFILPEYFHASSLLMMVAASVGEGSIVGWLLIKGARTQQAGTAVAQRN